MFSAWRKALLEDLARNANDKSLAGRVDAQIASLVSFINDNFEQYVTTSSCSGRVSLFHRGTIEDHLVEELSLRESKCDAPPNIESSQSISRARKRGSFGLGTLFQSHDPLPDVEGAVQGRLIPAVSHFWHWRRKLPLATPLVQQTELLQLKFEPMILHIRCRDVDAAAALLQCAGESAQGNSGILSCSRGTHEHRRITCCITSPVSYSIPLFVGGRWLLPVSSDDKGEKGCFHEDAAWQALLTSTVHHTNELFRENARRTQRFRCVLEDRELRAVR